MHQGILGDLIMNDLFGSLHTSTIATLLVISMVPTCLLMLVQAVYNGPLRNTVAPWGIVSLQFARTTRRSQEIVDSWRDRVQTAAIPGLWLDYLYLISYAITLALGCMWSARQLGDRFEGLTRLSENLPWLMLLAALFDATENLAHLVQLYSRPKPPWPLVAFLCATAKFLLVGLGALDWAAGVLVWVAFEPIDRVQIVIAAVGAGLLIGFYLRSLPELLRFAFRHAAVVFVVILVFGIVYGQIGTKYGIVSLFWNDRRTTRISASLGVSLRSDKPKLVIVSISGGATRSAYWSAVVLDRLESQFRGFGNHVRIITGASGGMVGAAYYVKQRQDLKSGAAAKPLSSMIPLDSITPVAAHIALRDVWQALLPRLCGKDRGVVLDQDCQQRGAGCPPARDPHTTRGYDARAATCQDRRAEGTSRQNARTCQELLGQPTPNRGEHRAVGSTQSMVGSACSGSLTRLPAGCPAEQRFVVRGYTRRHLSRGAERRQA
jgi:hypothetical protein